MIQRLRDLRLPLRSVPLMLFAIAVLAYGLLASRQGFYWDDWGFAWIGRTFGAEGFARYFSTNRPLRTFFYALTMPLLGQNPLAWQLFALFWRWLTAVSLWWALRQAFPRHAAQVTWLAALFLVYPGFSQQFIAINYSQFFFVQTLFLLSLGLMLWAARRGSRALLPAGLALVCSAVNLFTLEYFVGLDLLRPLLLWHALADAFPGRRDRLKAVLRHWLPYAVLLGIYLFWRVFIFRFQTYQPLLVDQAQSSPLATLLALPGRVLVDFALTSLLAWARALALPDPARFGTLSTLATGALLALGTPVLALFFRVLDAESGSEEKAARYQRAFRWLGLSFASMLLAGGVFWVTRLEITLTFPNDRFTLPFALGAAFLLVALIEFLPPRPLLKPALLGGLVALGIAAQFGNANLYRRDWETQRDFFWQFTWRAPELQPGTLLLSYESPFTYSSDNSLAAPFNWFYAPENRSQKMDLMYYYITVRLGGRLPAFTPGLPIHQDYLAAAFDGSTANTLVLHYAPPACLRILDPQMDLGIPLLPPELRDAQPLSNLERISTDPAVAVALPPALFGPEPGHGWCYYFEKADLARQRGDWEEVARLGKLAFDTGDYPNEVSERVLFIEAYARTGDWRQAEELTRQTLAITPLVRPMLCAAWQRAALAEPSDTASAMLADLGCLTP